MLGFYNPKLKTHHIAKERAQYWIAKGAQTSRTVHNLLVKTGVITRKKIPVPLRKKGAPGAGEASPSEAAPAEAAEAINA